MEIEAIVKKLEELENRIATIEGEPEKTIPKNKKKESIREFFSRIKPKSFPEKAACISYYSENHRDSASITAKECSDLLREAKETPSKNINDAMNQASRRGFLMEAGKKDGNKAWEITNTGIEWVEKKLRGD